MNDKPLGQGIIELQSSLLKVQGLAIEELKKQITELENTIKAVKGWLNKCEAEAFETANPFLMGAIGHALAEISEGGADD